MKCDEGKPSCNKCINTARVCDGYVPLRERNGKSKTGNSQRTLLPIRGSPIICAVARNPSAGIDGSQDQRRGFQYYQTRKFSQMVGNFEPGFWDSIILQYSHSYNTVQQSMLALSAIYEERNIDETIPRSSRNSEYALQQYTRAVATLSKYISMPDQNPQATLISCLLLVWVELLQRNIGVEFQHLFCGFRILEYLHETGVISNSTQGCKDVYETLIRSFIRLKIQVSIHGVTTAENATTNAAYHEMTGIEKSKTIPEYFLNVTESRECLEHEFKALFTYFRQDRNKMKTHGYPRPRNLCGNDIQHAHLVRLQKWQRATAITIANNPEEGHSCIYAYLHLYSLFVTLILSVSGSDEMEYDEHIEQFEEIVTLAEQLVQRYNVTHPVSFEMGVIPPLFFVGIKCRVLKIRR